MAKGLAKVQVGAHGCCAGPVGEGHDVNVRRVHDRLARRLKVARLHPRTGENAHGGERCPKGHADGEIDARVAHLGELGAACTLELAPSEQRPARARGRQRHLLVVAAGGIWTHADASALVERGADIVSVGRAAIVDPDWPTHVILQGKAPIRGPRTAEELQAVDVSKGFVQYLQRFPGLVTA